MSAGAHELANLHDIVMPAAAPWWPPAPGWYWVMGVVALLGAVLLWCAIAHWQRNRYRREALAQLARIEAAALAVQPGAKPPYAALPAMAELLKRTALTAYPREQVAALTGPAWFAFLDQTGGTAFSAGLGAALAHGNYCVGERSSARRVESTVEHIVEHIVEHRGEHRGEHGGEHRGEADIAAARAADIAQEIRRWIKQHGLVEGAQPAGTNPAAHNSTIATKPTKPANKKSRTAEAA